MSTEMLKKLSEYYNCSIDYLLGNSDVRNPIKFANSGGIDTAGLSKAEIEEIKKQVEFIKWKKSNGIK